MPWGALIDADGVYLAAKHTLSTALSLSLMLSERGDRAEPATPAVVVAAPDTGAAASVSSEGGRGSYMPIRGMYMPVRGGGMPVRGQGGICTALSAMAMVPLPAAKEEGQFVAGRFEGARLLTGKSATKAQVLQDGARCDTLHIATHGYADPWAPEFSGLLLAGTGDAPYDVLTAQEIYLWPLQARLVTLSACQTALGKDMEGEGLLGLTRAFIYAGAQDVVCTLWPVADESTKVLMAWFYDGLLSGKDVDEALQSAQAVLARNAATSDPFYWAGFTVVRGPE